MTSACTIHPFRDHLLGGSSDVAVAALVTAHPANRSAAHPSAANPSLHRALGPANGAAHVRSYRADARRPQARLPRSRIGCTIPIAPQLRGFVQSGFYEVAHYDAARGWP
ncbi:hypothetical protein [Bradyrhizobium sp. 131]|uniref:hypothetical protein n=1 Tax=Bradyrhizobium sp. 131 TaxID=2782609 RepID=UPI001FFFC847|nr:hypothetical protein [Bradyrhizobium sp. 131]UPK20593.1 hypothetical protein IVA73_06175 [Bradyrhizobium sp. 131]